MGKLTVVVESPILGSHKLTMLSRLIERSQNEALGLLVRLWLWAAEFAPNGKLRPFPLQGVADAIGFDGAGEALFARLDEAGWVDLVEGEYVIHDWRKHSGRSLCKQRKRREYMQEYRAKKKAGVSLQPEELPPQSEPEVKEEPKPGPPKAKAALLPELEAAFDQFWAAYPRKIEKGKARLTWGKLFGKIKHTEKAIPILSKIESEIERIDAELQRKAVTVGKEEALRYVKHPATFLNGIRTDYDAGYIHDPEDGD